MLSHILSRLFFSLQKRLVFLIFIESRNKAGLKDLKDLIKSIGGWSLIDLNWNPENYHWEDAYVQTQLIIDSISNIGFPFHISMTKDVKNLSENIIEVFILNKCKFFCILK